jgi:hypothetical protein
MTDIQQDRIDDMQADVIGHYNPVRVSDTVGTFILGLIALVLLIALLRSQGRNRRLLIQLAEEAQS